MVKELIRKTDFIHCGVYSSGPKFLADSCAHAADSDAIFDADDNAVVSRHGDDARCYWHHPAWVDDGGTNTLIRQALAHLKS